MKLPKLKFLGTLDGLKLYTVSGEHIRNHIDIDFTQGGNEAVYPEYNPKNEIWLDDTTTPLDQTATALHEIVERHLMMTRGMDYDQAHDIASETEMPFRQELARSKRAGHAKTFDIDALGKKWRAFLAKDKKMTAAGYRKHTKEKLGAVLVPRGAHR